MIEEHVLSNVIPGYDKVLDYPLHFEIIPVRMCLVFPAVDQKDKFVTFGTGFRGFESSHHRSMRQVFVGCGPLPEYNVHCYGAREDEIIVEHKNSNENCITAGNIATNEVNTRLILNALKLLVNILLIQDCHFSRFFINKGLK